MEAAEKIKTALTSMLQAFENKVETPVEAAATVDVTTSEGKVLTVTGELVSGSTVVDETGAAPADAEYQLTDGAIITVVGGVITEVATAPEPAEAPMMPDMSKMEADFAEYKATTENVINELRALVESNKAELEKVSVELASHKTQINATFEVVKTFAEMPQEVEAPKKSHFELKADEKTEAKKRAINTIREARKK